MKYNKNHFIFDRNHNKYNHSNLIKYACFMFILLVTFTAIYILNKNTHYVSDDFRYHFMYEGFLPDKTPRRITNLKDIFYSMYNHYFMWGGRITAHALVQFILIFDKSIFNLVNSIVFVGLALLIYMHCNINKKINLTLLICILFSLWFFIPQFGLTILWASGACNYLWCGFIILLFLLPFRRYIENNTYTKDSIFKNITMILIGFFAGWTNENSGGAMILLIMLFLLYYKLHNIKIPKWAIGGFISSSVGFILLVIAPGNNARKEYMTKKTVNLLSNLSKVLDISFTLCIMLLILLLIVLILFLLTNSDKKLISKQLLLSTMYIVSALAGIIVLIVSPQIDGRTWFGPIIFIIIAIGNLYSCIDFNKYNLNIILSIFIIIVGFKVVQQYKVAYSDITKTFNSINIQIDTINQEKSRDNLDVEVPAIQKPKSSYNAFYGSRYLSDDKNSWINQWMAKYYEVNSIVGVN